ncbi:MAG TPA: hypothetical protein VMV95_04300 [Bacillota bacterium]|nr:hypothetical protein [Bacillota bacterium]
MNNKGWIRIAEAFVSILILVGAAIVVVTGGIQKNDISDQAYEVEMAIFREVSLNDSLRSEIIGTTGTIEWDNFPSQTKNKILAKTPWGLECIAKICPLESTCLLDEEFEKNVYVDSTFIFSTLTNYNPRIIKLFCNE